MPRYLSQSILVLLAALGPLTGAEQEALTLVECIHIALERHPDVAKSRASAEILKGKIREVRAQAFPEVNFNSSFTRWRDPSLLNASGIDKFPPELLEALVPHAVNLFDYSISFKQPIYTAGKVRNAMKLASVESEGAMADIDRSEQDLALNALRAFYALMWAERYRVLVAETLEQKKLHAATARSRFENGVATEVDVLRSEVAVANVKPDLVRADHAVGQTRALLNYHLVRPIDFPTRAMGGFQDQPWEEWDLEVLCTEGIRRRPEMHRSRIAERSAAVQLDLARAESRMRVESQGAYGTLARDPTNLVSAKYFRWLVGVNFTLPVFDGFRRSGLVYQATAAERVARLEREKLEQQVRLALQRGLDEVKAAQETIAASQANIQQAEKVLLMTQNNYKYGAATTLDIIDAQTALSVARSNLLRGQHDYAVARASLRWSLGRTPWE